MQRAFWLNNELKKKPYNGFDQRNEELDSEDDADAMHISKNNADDDVVVPDQKMLNEMKFLIEKERS